MVLSFLAQGPDCVHHPAKAAGTTALLPAVAMETLRAKTVTAVVDRAEPQRAHLRRSTGVNFDSIWQNGVQL